MRFLRPAWGNLPLTDRIRYIRYILPPLLALWVVTYQLLFAQALETAYGHSVHYGVEIAFYSLAGPVVTWLTLIWVERNLLEKERLQQKILVVEREKSAVLEEDRARIARDLHDGIAQTLYFLALKADMLRQQLRGQTQIEDELRDMGDKIRWIIREVRRTIYALQPLNWSEVGFLTALSDYVLGFAEQAGWHIEVDMEPGVMIATEFEPTIFRVVQESLNNVAKHAEAKHVWISLNQEGSGLLLIIGDDGFGFEPNNHVNRGFGLIQMQERVKNIGGTLHFESQPKQGMVIYARIPQAEYQNE